MIFCWEPFSCVCKKVPENGKIRRNTIAYNICWKSSPISYDLLPVLGFPISALGLELSLIWRPGSKLSLDLRFFLLIRRNIFLSWVCSELLCCSSMCSCSTWLVPLSSLLQFIVLRKLCGETFWPIETRAH